MSKGISRKVKERQKRSIRRRQESELLQRNAEIRTRVVKFDAPMLYSKALDIKDREHLTEINNTLGFDLFNRMKRTVIAFKNGAGLSANQINVPYNVCVIRFDTKKNDTFIMVNPKIVEHCEDQEEETEGCLSFPEYYTKIKRYHCIKVEYLDENFEKKVANYHGYEARVVLHEIDHLLGVPCLSDVYRKSKEEKVK
jgi:peptide deformylase